MKEFLTLETNEKTSLVSAMAEKLLVKMREYHQSSGCVEVELEKYSATIKMTLEINFKNETVLP